MSEPLSLHYASQSMHYTTQFIASMSNEEVVIDCGSVVVPVGDEGQKQLPIHTRMALPWSAVERLHRLLGDLIESRDKVAAPGDLDTPTAALPPLSFETPLTTSPNRAS